MNPIFAQVKVIAVLLLICLTGPVAHAQDYRTADRSSAGIAPAPADEPEALVQIYAARAYHWRKYFAVHCWIATKDKDADHYTTYQVTGFRVGRGGNAVMISDEVPDRKWFGATPDLLFSMKGEAAEKAIPQIKELAQNYIYNHRYQVWPGPNSNTFVSHIIRNVPGIGVELPPHAIGKDWINDGDLFGWSETGTGAQFSLFGLFGFTVGLAEGIEVDVLGLSFGLDFWRPAIKLPLIGRLGFKDAPVF